MSRKSRTVDNLMIFVRLAVYSGFSLDMSFQTLVVAGAWQSQQIETLSSIKKKEVNEDCRVYNRNIIYSTHL